MNGRSTRSLTLNLGLRYDLQFLHAISTDTNNVSPRGGFAWTPFASRKTVVRGSLRTVLRPRSAACAGQRAALGRQHHQRQHLSQISISLSPTQAGAPVFPNILSSCLPPGVLFNFTTMNPHMQNAYSEQGSFEIEQQLGKQQHTQRRLSARARTASAHFRQSECADLRRLRNQQRLPPEPELRAITASILAGRFALRRPARLLRATARRDGAATASPTRIRRRSTTWASFSSARPSNNFNIWQDYGRSDDDQRHRLVFDGAMHSPQHAKPTAWPALQPRLPAQRLLQYYSPLPFNITREPTPSREPPPGPPSAGVSSAAMPALVSISST